jgi:hypothetical protein
MIRSLSLRIRSAAASSRASGEPAEAFALVELALLVEREPRAGLALERLTRAALADVLAGERLGWAGPDVVFAVGVDFELPLLASIHRVTGAGLSGRSV